MSFSPKEYKDLLTFFSDESSAARHIISLALNEVNSTIQPIGGITTPTTTTTTAIAYTETTTADLEDIYAFVNDTFLLSSTTASVNHSADASVGSIRPRISADIPFWLIPCYSIILLFAIVGNVLVITTLVQNRRMRTITNLFLLNLAISDILLGVLCTPVTLVGTLLRHFIFGEFLCKFIPFAQAASVAVSSWTLVAISCERYYAICHPLKSRTWQTLSHAYKIIGFIWCGSIVCMTPIAVFSQLMPTSRQGLRKCREHWPDNTVGYERSYNIFLDLILLVLPLIILCVAYILITRTLYVSMQEEQAMIYGRTGGGSIGSTPNKVNIQPTTATATITKTPLTTTLLQGKRPTRSSSGFNLNVSFRCHIDGVSGRTTAIVNGLTESATDNREANKNDDDADGGDGPEELDLNSSTHTKNTIANNEQRKKCQVTALNAECRQGGGGETKRKLLMPSDGRHLAYCIRSASVKSLNRNNNETDPTDEVGSEASAVSSTSMTVINVHPHPCQQRAKTCHQSMLQQQQPNGERERRKSNSTPSLRITEAALRRSNVTKNLESKKRVVKMLFVLVLEFFVCWTPLYVINTVSMFVGPAIYEYIDYTSISFFQLLAYSSSCCNPITYCFMNAGFRRAFLDTFRGLPPLSAAATAGGRFWRKHRKHHHQTNTEMNLSMAGNSITMANSVTNTMLDSPRL